MANTDTKSYLHLTNCIYRFQPILLSNERLATIHGNDECINVEAVKKEVIFYHSFVLIANEKFQLKTKPGKSSGEL